MRQPLSTPCSTLPAVLLLCVTPTTAATVGLLCDALHHQHARSAAAERRAATSAKRV